MDINLGDSITKMVNEISKRYEVATTSSIDLYYKANFVARCEIEM